MSFLSILLVGLILDFVEIESGPQPDAVVIWLHGLGADGSDFVPVVPALGLEGLPGVRFIFPSAPYQAVTCNGGYEMRAWYDILSLAPEHRRIDERGLMASCAAVGELIERERARGMAVGRIFLAGFSQGGAVAYVTALTYPLRLGGVIALSTYLPVPERVARDASPENADLPIFAAHGSEDDVVSPALGRQARDFLLARGGQVAWHEYPLAHSVSATEVADIGRWLRARL